jgi:hypothetical protein
MFRPNWKSTVGNTVRFLTVIRFSTVASNTWYGNECQHLPATVRAERRAMLAASG